MLISVGIVSNPPQNPLSWPVTKSSQINANSAAVVQNAAQAAALLDYLEAQGIDVPGARQWVSGQAQ